MNEPDTDTTVRPGNDPATAGDGFRPPSAPVRLLYRRYQREELGAEDLTPEEQAEWDEYRRATEEFEARRDRLGLVDLADVMENGVTKPEMLTESLVKSEHHVVFGARESAKTWLVLRDAVALIGRGEAVIWVDKEMGRKNVADRLLTLGAQPDEVRQHFAYMEFPSMDCGPDSKAAWRALLEDRQPSLVVVDAQTEVLADAGLNENLGTDVEKWSQAYVTPARRIEAATVMIDHTGHSESGRPVASRQKGAAAKVELAVTCPERFGRDRIGLVTVQVTKNTVSAPIPEKRSWRIGGKDRAFVFEPADGASDPRASAKAARAERIETAIEVELHNAEGPLTTNQMVQMVEGNRQEIIRVLKRLALSDTSPVRQSAGPNRSVLYSISEVE